MKILVFFLACLASHSVQGQGGFADYEIVSLMLHNMLRAMHQNTPPMELDADLNQRAQQCAQYYAMIGTIDHTCPVKGRAGENLWLTFTNMGSAIACIMAATEDFYREVFDYNFNNPGFSFATGHFTQMVWIRSTRLGVGYFRDSSRNRNYVVNLYLEPGNINTPAAFRSNVRPLIGMR